MDLAIRLLQVNNDEGSVPLIIVDDGRDYESLYAEWCALDDAYCDGRLPEREWRDISTFLLERGVEIVEPTAVQELGDYYGIADSDDD